MDRTNGKEDINLDELNFEREIKDREYICSFFKNFIPLNEYKEKEVNEIQRLKTNGQQFNKK